MKVQLLGLFARVEKTCGILGQVRPEPAHELPADGLVRFLELSVQRGSNGNVGVSPMTRLSLVLPVAAGASMLTLCPRLLAAHRRGQDPILRGPLANQCALYGVIHQLDALGLELLEVRRRTADGARRRGR
jgi:hypothetical protein